MFILVYMNKFLMPYAHRFDTMEKLLLFVNQLITIKKGYPYLILQNHRIIADYQYFLGVYKKKDKLINTSVDKFIAGHNLEMEWNKYEKEN